VSSRTGGRQARISIREATLSRYWSIALAATARTRACTLSAATILMTVLACSPASVPTPVVAVNAGRAPAASPAERGRLSVGSLERTFLYFAPPNLPIGSAAVLVFHGAGGEGARIRGFIGPELERLASEHGFVVVYPDGYGGHWNDCRAHVPYPAKLRHIDDVGFVRSLIRWLGSSYGVDSSRVRAIGFSNGGHFAFRLAFEMPGEIEAVAVAGANLPVPEEFDCEVEAAAVPMMLVNGTADPVNPYAGGMVTAPDGARLGLVRSARATAEHFAHLAGYGMAEVREEWVVPADPNGSGVHRISWSRPHAAEIAFYTVVCGGHTIPDPVAQFPEFLGAVERRLKAVEEAVRFFERQRQRVPDRPLFERETDLKRRRQTMETTAC
jgi:polyhydroxybutyrate depolymerase